MKLMNTRSFFKKKEDEGNEAQVRLEEVEESYLVSLKQHEAGCESATASSTGC